MRTRQNSSGHVFISYCRDDYDQVSELCDELESKGTNIWWDEEILPGQNWKHEIKEAMKKSFAVIVCLSENLEKRLQSGVYPEISDAIDAYRKLVPGSIFIIPVKLSECDIPEIDINERQKLDDIQHVNIYQGKDRERGIKKLLKSLHQAEAKSNKKSIESDSFKRQVPSAPLGESKSAKNPEESKNKIVKVVLDVPYREFGSREENTLVGGLANFLDIPQKNILIKNVQEGSVVIILELPEEAARKFLSTWREPQLSASIEKLKIKTVQDVNTITKTVKAELSLHEFGMDGEWSLNNLSEFSRVYSQVYHLLFSLEVNQPEKTEFRISQIYQSYPWRGGYSRVNFYKSVESAIPSDYSPKVSSISYASPGSMNLRLVKPVAQNIEASIYAMYHRNAFVHDLYRDIYKSMSVMKLNTLSVRNEQKTGENNPLNILTQKELHFIDHSLFYFAEELVFEDVDTLCELTGNRLAALKIILSLYRRFQRLVDLAKRDLIEFKV